mmetsp:Transcript_65668/g.140413  ORF Transcript_65668/g.140413 Transcript_65668/m.140413 type:complete len:224 (-) Transcript_65668:1506-2177(-)
MVHVGFVKRIMGSPSGNNSTSLVGSNLKRILFRRCKAADSHMPPSPCLAPPALPLEPPPPPPPSPSESEPGTVQPSGGPSLWRLRKRFIGGRTWAEACTTEEGGATGSGSGLEGGVVSASTFCRSVLASGILAFSTDSSASFTRDFMFSRVGSKPYPGRRCSSKERGSCKLISASWALKESVDATARISCKNCLHLAAVNVGPCQAVPAHFTSVSSPTACLSG